MRIALFTTATRNYIEFVPQLLESAKKYFFVSDVVTFVIFTDKENEIKHLLDEYPGRIIINKIDSEKFPYISMDRCKHYANYMANNPIAKDFDYCYAIDADAKFVDFVGQTIVANSIGVKHCAYLFGGETNETNPKSTCFIQNKKTTYYGGGFYGGESFWFYFMNKQMNEYLQKDKENGIIPIWHDESALNKFFSVYPPEKSLTPSYHFPSWGNDDECNPYIKSIWDKNKVEYDPIIVFLEKTYKNKGVEYFRS